MKYYLRGGIGDLLQSLWFIKNNPNEQYLVHAHYKNIKEIFDHYGVQNSHFYLFNDAESHNIEVDQIKEDHAKNDQSEIKETPRAFYSDLDFGIEANEEAQQLINSFPEKKKIIGIHPFRSQFAVSIYNNFNLPAKIIPSEITETIIQGQENYIIFGSKKELEDYGVKETSNVKFVCFDNILSSLSCVKYCSSLIGLDSGFKTASSMQRINTICIIGDFEDPTRDAFFINQYFKDGIMKVFKTKNLETDKEEILNFIKQNL